MDKEQAKFILESFRPDGADATDADFAEALELAASDRELGEWLADERAADAEFAMALGELEIPEQLRQNIFNVMHGGFSEDPEIDRELDVLFQDGLADVEPPEGLREQILTAMSVQAGGDKVTAMPERKKARGFRFFRMASVAAALILGVFMALQMTKNLDGLIDSYDVQMEVGEVLNATDFSVDHPGKSVNELNTWLVNHQVPSAEVLPAGIRDLEAVGCKKVRLPGEKHASLVCFKGGPTGSVHLIVMENKYVRDNKDLPLIDQVKKDDCYHCSATDWNVIRWRDEKQTYVLLARHSGGKKQKNEMLRYF